MLSRLDAETPATQARVDLGALAQRVVAELAPKALAKRQVLSFEAQPGCVVAGDETLLAVLVRNLVDNALRYTPAEGGIDVTIARDADGVCLAVDDSGPGLAEPDLARLGERFFRVPGSAESGSGLGWSIVQRIAAAHRANCAAQRSRKLGGLSVGVVFPAA
jgi:two-component system sensor histidine kinase QseC